MTLPIEVCDPGFPLYLNYLKTSEQVRQSALNVIRHFNYFQTIFYEVSLHSQYFSKVLETNQYYQDEIVIDLRIKQNVLPQTTDCSLQESQDSSIVTLIHFISRKENNIP